MMTPKEKAEKLCDMALRLNSDMPTDVMLKGDGSIWVKEHGNDGIHPRKLRQEEVLRLIYKAMVWGDQMISV